MWHKRFNVRAAINIVKCLSLWQAHLPLKRLHVAGCCYCCCWLCFVIDFLLSSCCLLTIQLLHALLLLMPFNCCLRYVVFVFESCCLFRVSDLSFAHVKNCGAKSILVWLLAYVGVGCLSCMDFALFSGTCKFLKQLYINCSRGIIRYASLKNWHSNFT